VGRTLYHQALEAETGRAVLELISGYAETGRLLLEYDDAGRPCWLAFQSDHPLGRRTTTAWSGEAPDSRARWWYGRSVVVLRQSAW